MSRGSRRKRSSASSPGPESPALGSPPPDATRPDARAPSPDSPDRHRFSWPRTSTLVLSVVFVAVFALWIMVRPDTPETRGESGPYNPNSGGTVQRYVPPPTHGPTPAQRPTPTHRPSPGRTPTGTPTPTPAQTSPQSPTTGSSPTATSGTQQVPVSPTPTGQSPAPATGGGAAGSSPTAGTTQAPAGVSVGVATPLSAVPWRRPALTGRPPSGGRRAGGTPGGC